MSTARLDPNYQDHEEPQEEESSNTKTTQSHSDNEKPPEETTKPNYLYLENVDLPREVVVDAIKTDEEETCDFSITLTDNESSDEKDEKTETHSLSRTESDDEESSSDETEICTPTVIAWKLGGVLGSFCSTLTYTLGTAYSYALINLDNNFHPNYGHLFTSIGSIAIPFSMGACASKILNANNMNIKLAAGSFILFGALTGTIDAVAGSRLYSNETSPYVVPAATFIGMSLIDVALPEVCYPQLWKKIPKIGDSCFSWWNRKSSSQNNTNEPRLVVNETVNVNERSSLISAKVR